MKDIHMIGAAHLDVVWLWPYSEGLSEIKSTFSAACDRLDEYPDFVFTCSSAGYYEYIEKYFPELFARIKKYVAEGRWIPVGGWWVQPDVNMPCGEALVRHGLYSQRFYQERFGKICDVGYNVDSFGHPSSLPQILKKSGMDSYVFSRPRPIENNTIPDIFDWVGEDGSSVIGTRLDGYGGPLKEAHSEISLLPIRIQKAREKKILPDAEEDNIPRMRYFGVANHGGGPTISMLNELEKMFKEDKQLFYGEPSEYMKCIKDIPKLQWKNELQAHAVGCYTLHLPIKQMNRRTETALISAETLGAFAHMTLGVPMSTKALAEGWKKVMTCQFHDSLSGCCLRSTLIDMENMYGHAAEIARETGDRALQQMTWAIDTAGDSKLPSNKDDDMYLWGYTDRGMPMVVYNPLPFEVTRVIETCVERSAVRDDDGTEYQIQNIRNKISSTNVRVGIEHNAAFIATIPAFGYKTFWTVPGENQTKPDAGLVCTRWLMENSKLRVEFDRKGYIKQITQKASGKAFLAGASAVPIVLDEFDSDSWSHTIWSYKKVVGRFKFAGARVMAEGPVRAILRIEYKYGDSRMHQDFILDRDSDHLDVQLYVNWREEHKFLKWEIKASNTDGHYTAENQFGAITREADGRELPLQRWLDAGSDEAGLGIATDGGFGADVEGNVIRMSVLRSPLFADHVAKYDKKGKRDGYGEFSGQGESRVSYRIVPRAGKLIRSDITRRAMELNTEFMPIFETYHKGPLARCGSALEVSESNIIVTSLKEAEDGGAYVLRAYECDGKETKCVIKLPMAKREFELAFAHNEIKTVVIPFDANAEAYETDLIERKL